MPHIRLWMVYDTALAHGPGGQVWTLKQMTAVGAEVIGVPAFSVGVKGGFSSPLLPLNESAFKGLNCNASSSKEAAVWRAT